MSEAEETAISEIESSLQRRANELWGADRAEALGPVIAETARHIWLVTKDPPPHGDEPAFVSPPLQKGG